MADKTSISSYNSSGFGQSSGVSDVKGQLGNYSTDDAALRTQAESQYAETYASQQQSYRDQIAGLIKAQTDDSELLNKQYEQSMSSMMAQLQKRGLAVGGLPSAQNAALDKFRNEVMTQRQNVYGVQQNAVKASQKAHADSYDANVRQRIYDLKNYNLEMTNQILTTIAELQNNSYQAYIDYLLAEKSKRSRISSRRSYSSYNPSTPQTPAPAAPGLGADYFKPKTTTASANKAIANSKAVGGGGAGKNLMATK